MEGMGAVVPRKFSAGPGFDSIDREFLSIARIIPHNILSDFLRLAPSYAYIN